MTKILVIEQSKSVRNNLHERLLFEGYKVDAVEDINQAAGVGLYDVVLVDDANFRTPHLLSSSLFIVMSNESTIEAAVAAVHAGAYEFLTKPLDMNRLLASVRRLEHEREVSVEESHAAPVKRTVRRSSSIEVEEMIGCSIPMVKLRNIMDKVAPSDARVMILGENGTGKEMVARWIHHKSQRASRPFVEINCAAIPSELIESELFGHEKGAFTSAIKMRRGKFEQAHGGTLFMDEIGDMSLSAQAKVLRALQERKICRVGSDKDIDVDVRVLAATNKDIRAEIERGNFREDLYHRIGVIEMVVAPLRQRSEDIPLLIDAFLNRICADYNISPVKSVSPEAMSRLKTMRWSGNIRQLRNIVERLVILSSDSTISLQDVEAHCEIC
ncbi:MAG: sigma-54 dependent transcriptional regulator [Rikenellaceae bacterium]